MLSKDFFSLIALSLLIASALSWFAMNAWLQNFPYRIEIQWWMFALGGATAVIIAVVTVGIKTVKAAMSNPVTLLRTE
jgi:putative ABC transport system permease protein